MNTWFKGLLAAIVFSSLTFVVYHYDWVKVRLDESFMSMPAEEDLNQLLNDGFDQIIEAEKVRDAIAESGRDINKEEHLPELRPLMNRMQSFYREELKNDTELLEKAELIFEQMESEYAHKSLAFWKWNLFHVQMNVLVSDVKKSPNFLISNSYITNHEADADKKSNENLVKWGKLDFKSKKLLNRKRNFSDFVALIYTKDGILGLRTLNYAYMKNMMPLAMTTNHDFGAHGGTILTPAKFTFHDQSHYSAFREYYWSQEPGITVFRKIFNSIDQQPNLLQKAKDHVALFLMVHELNNYVEAGNSSFSEIADLSQIKIAEKFMRKVLKTSHLKRSFTSSLRRYINLNIDNDTLTIYADSIDSALPNFEFISDTEFNFDVRIYSDKDEEKISAKQESDPDLNYEDELNKISKFAKLNVKHFEKNDVLEQD